MSEYNMEKLLDKIEGLEVKMNEIIEYNKAATRRAWMAMVWKIIFFIILVVIPTYLSMKLVGSFFTPEMMAGVSSMLKSGGGDMTGIIQGALKSSGANQAEVEQFLQLMKQYQ
ncbi:hypothetical protein COB57_06050 [Candidatus Peregrinibacteria bacterium]|nr:MAG: hypothetical protein COB57_06050 [Candidatus Peregrinibacteria bacterium]